MITAIVAIALLAAAFGLLLGYTAIRFHVEGDPIADQLDALLPQSQCGQCGYPGCRPYAEAVASGEAEINLCSPGGESAMLAIADLLGREPVEVGEVEEKPKSIATIDEQICIGCTKCISVCPVDAIVGATKQLHGILAFECTGCELCIDSCPVDCIHMQPIPETVSTWKWPYPMQPRVASARPGQGEMPPPSSPVPDVKVPEEQREAA
jgi:electron transport complex protein RnfB